MSDMREFDPSSFKGRQAIRDDSAESRLPEAVPGTPTDVMLDQIQAELDEFGEPQDPRIDVAEVFRALRRELAEARKERDDARAERMSRLTRGEEVVFRRAGHEYDGHVGRVVHIFGATDAYEVRFSDGETVIGELAEVVSRLPEAERIIELKGCRPSSAVSPSTPTEPGQDSPSPK